MTDLTCIDTQEGPTNHLYGERREEGWGGGRREEAARLARADQLAGGLQ